MRKKIFVKVLIIILFITVAMGCDPAKKYSVAPVPVFSDTLTIDSAYTSVSAIPTGNSSLLFCGKKDIFDSYSILKFDSIPDSFDSLFIQLQSDSIAGELTLYEIKKQWDENSVYLWDDLDSLIDTLHPLLIESVNDSNPRIFIGSSSTLDYSVIQNIGNFGLAVHADPFYSFNAEETQLELDTVSGDSLLNSVVPCIEDAFIVKNPFQDSIFSDSLLVGRGLSIRSHILIPRDSLPSNLSSIAKAELIFDVDTAFSFSVVSTVKNSGFTFYPSYTTEHDSAKFEMALFFQQAVIDSVLDIQIRASSEVSGVGLEKLGGGIIKFIWVEFPR